MEDTYGKPKNSKEKYNEPPEMDKSVVNSGEMDEA